MVESLSSLPDRIERPSAWLGSEMAANPSRWLYQLTSADIDDLERAAEHYLSCSDDLAGISKQSFPLSIFSGHLQELHEKLLNGVGVELIRGLPASDYDRKFVATIFCGIGAHIGSVRSQNAQGHSLGHVRDIGANPDNTNTRIYQTSARQTFHTDSTDVVGLLCLRSARDGGESLLVSAETLYNRMRSERPDLLLRLFDVVATDRRGETPVGALPYFEIPVLSWFEGLLTVQYQRQYVDSAQRFAEAPQLSVQQVEALDYFDALANDPDLHLSMELQAGDMQFVYNHSQLHDRMGFKDWPDPQQRRHLLRLWLSVDGDRNLPQCFAARYGSTEVGNRGGIMIENTKLNAPLD